MGDLTRKGIARYPQCGLQEKTPQNACPITLTSPEYRWAQPGRTTRPARGPAQARSLPSQPPGELPVRLGLSARVLLTGLGQLVDA